MKRLQKLIATLLVLTLTFILTSCTDPIDVVKNTLKASNSDRVRNPVYAAELVPSLSDSNNAFAFDLLPKLVPNNDGNIFFSPYSISSAIGMLYNGAQGDTKEEIAQVFHWKDLSDSRFNSGQKYLYDTLNNKESVDLLVSNSIWINEMTYIDIKKDFLLQNQEVFNAKTDTVDLTSIKGIDQINQWISDRTNAQVPQMLAEPYSEDTPMILVNAIYFLGGWENEFYKSATGPETFYGANAEAQVPMMHVNDSFSYMKTETYESIALPYRDYEAKMVVVMPTDAQIDEFLSGLTFENYKEIVLKVRNYEKVNLTFPKFSIDYGVESIASALQELGMPTSFEAQHADFSGISQQALDYELRVSDVLHKAVIDVDEEGTEAAAVTAVIMETTSAEDPTEPVYMTVDHPYIFFIVDDTTDTILFIGVVRNL